MQTQTYPRSLKSGDTVALRKFVAAATVDNGAPTTSGNQMAATGLYRNIDVVADCAVALGSFKFTVWWYYATADKWTKDANLTDIPVTNAAGTKVGVAFPYASDAIYIQVHTFAGVGATADVWLVGRE